MLSPKYKYTSGARHSTSRPASHCRVLPPGEFNGIIPESLQQFHDVAETVFPQCYNVNTHRNKQRRLKTTRQRQSLRRGTRQVWRTITCLCKLLRKTKWFCSVLCTTTVVWPTDFTMHSLHNLLMAAAVTDHNFYILLYFGDKYRRLLSPRITVPHADMIWW